MTYLDTHVVAWLYADGIRRLPEPVIRHLEEEEDLRVSPMARLELQYLYEIGRVAHTALTVVDTMESTLGLRLCQASFPAVVREAESHTWTRDSFDRFIVAQAALFDAPLITKDDMIHRHYPYAFWSAAGQ